MPLDSIAGNDAIPDLELVADCCVLKAAAIAIAPLMPVPATRHITVSYAAGLAAVKYGPSSRSDMRYGAEGRGEIWFSGSWASFEGGIEASSMRLASLLVHCLLDCFFFGWSAGVVELDVGVDGLGSVSLLRNRNWIIVVSSFASDNETTFFDVELGVATFWDARCVMVVKGWISRMEDCVWWIWKCASGE